MTDRVTSNDKASFTIDRTFDAPRDRVYLLWTDPRLVALWWGCDGATNDVSEFDVRPGGKWRINMTVPGGAVYPNAGVFRVVVPNELIEYSETMPGQPGSGLIEIWHRVAFIDVGAAKTRVELIVSAPTAEDCAHLLRIGIQTGATQSFERMNSLLERDEASWAMESARA